VSRSVAALCLLLVLSVRAQVCDPAGNLFLLSNCDGGIVTINVDQDIPNLVIGISTYEPVQVTITGPFATNVVQVLYAGMNSSQNNNNCGQGSGEPSVVPVVGLGVVHRKSSTMSPSAGRGLLPAPQSQGRTTFSRPPASPFQPSTRT
jgi:hypothetical protein